MYTPTAILNIRVLNIHRFGEVYILKSVLCVLEAIQGADTGKNLENLTRKIHIINCYLRSIEKENCHALCRTIV